MVTDVTLSRLIGVALMCRPFTTTVWSRCAGRLKTATPISRNSFLPLLATASSSFGEGALAVLGTGSPGVDQRPGIRRGLLEAARDRHDVDFVRWRGCRPEATTPPAHAPSVTDSERLIMAAVLIPHPAPHCVCLQVT